MIVICEMYAIAGACVSVCTSGKSSYLKLISVYSILQRHFAKRMATSGSEKGHAERTAEIEREKVSTCIVKAVTLRGCVRHVHHKVL